MKKKAKYICFEGTEGVGKTTQTKKLVDHLRSKGFKVLQTKEPGTDHVPLTMLLRGIMLDNKYDQALTAPAREFISQAIRSIHLEKLVIPSLNEYDFIVQDRGILSGYAYGQACGNKFENLQNMAIQNVDSATDFAMTVERLYDKVIYLKGDTAKGLQKALSAKQEFETGDAMESRGNTFLNRVSNNMENYSSYFNTVKIDVDGKDIDTVFNEILAKLDLKDV